RPVRRDGDPALAPRWLFDEYAKLGRHGSSYIASMAGKPRVHRRGEGRDGGAAKVMRLTHGPTSPPLTLLWHGGCGIPNGWGTNRRRECPLCGRWWFRTTDLRLVRAA